VTDGSSNCGTVDQTVFSELASAGYLPVSEHVVAWYQDRGMEEAQRWFNHWHTRPEKGRVTRWDILELLFDAQQERAAVEWDFECVYDGKVGSFPGASLFGFDPAKITSIREFKTEKEQYRPYQQ
jgi:hypothetical protein